MKDCASHAYAAQLQTVDSARGTMQELVKHSAEHAHDAKLISLTDSRAQLQRPSARGAREYVLPERVHGMRSACYGQAQMLVHNCSTNAAIHAPPLSMMSLAANAVVGCGLRIECALHGDQWLQLSAIC